MEEIIKSVKSDLIEFECKKCGNCCKGDSGHIWLTEKEQQDIASFLGIPLKKFLKTYTVKSSGRISLKEKKISDNDYWCIFLDKDKGCLIYEHRPHQCRTYPYWENIINDSEYLDFVLQDCPGVSLKKIK
jgi:Fe-S-cluster containining protein